MSRSTAKDGFCILIDELIPDWRNEYADLFKETFANLHAAAQDDDLPPLEDVDEQQRQRDEEISWQEAARRAGWMPKDEVKARLKRESKGKGKAQQSHVIQPSPVLSHFSDPPRKPSMP